MYLRILKKDLKRKKTMNIILLIFIILSATFIASSVNNIVTVSTALDYFFEKAGVPDYFLATLDQTGKNSIAETLDAIPEIESYRVESIIYATSANILYEGEELENGMNTAVLMPFECAAINYFDKDNNVIEAVERGTVIVSGKVLSQSNLAVGDMIEIKIGDTSAEFRIAGICKDAVLGSNMMGMSRFMICEEDYEQFQAGEMEGTLCYINTSNVEAVAKALSNEDTIITNVDKAMVKMTYVMDMVIAGVLLIVSVCLILIAFVVLRFTIAFTLTEEYREIGVMKAIGISNTKIRGLYMVKYLVLAVIGAFIGFFASIPFGNMLIQSVSESMVLGNDSSMLVNMFCSVGVVVIILLFSFGCTGKVKKFTPIDAIRSGTTGERFHKKGVLRLTGVPTKPAFFLAANDVLSSPKRFATVIVAYTLCLSLVLILVNTVNTLRSDELTSAFGFSECDIYYSDDERIMSFFHENGRAFAEKTLDEIERTLAENGMSADCAMEVICKPTFTYGEQVFKSLTMQGVGTTTDMYIYYEGTPPQNVNEIAVTPLTAQKLGAKIGDTVTMNYGDTEAEYIITAYFQTMNNLGEGVRLHGDVDIDFSYISGFFSFQISFEDNPDEETILERVEKVKDIYHTDQVWTAGEFIERMVGVAGTLDSVRMLVLALAMVVVILVTVLMERSFIAKERGEIAILKAIGFKSRSITGWHTIRFGIVSIISTIISLLLINPLTEISVGPVFKMMGADYGVEYKIVPLEVYVIYPCIVLVVTIISAYITALYTRRITASEASSIE